MCDPRDLNRHRASAAAGPEPRDHRHRQSVPGGSATYCSGESTISLFFSRELTARAAFRRHAAHNDIRSQYAYANNMLVQLLYESSSEQAEHRPLSEGKKPRGGLPIPESGRWIWWERKKIGTRPSSFPLPDPSPQRELRGAKHTQWKPLTMRAVDPLESRLCVLRSQADHAQTVCIPTCNVAWAGRHTQSITWTAFFRPYVLSLPRL